MKLIVWAPGTMGTKLLRRAPAARPPVWPSQRMGERAGRRAELRIPHGPAPVIEVTAPDQPGLYRLPLLSPNEAGMGRVRLGETVVGVAPAERRPEIPAPMDF